MEDHEDKMVDSEELSDIEDSDSSGSDIDEAELAEPWTIDEDLVETNTPLKIVLPDIPFDVAFHPKTDFMATSLISGEIQLWKYSVEGNSLAHKFEFTTEPCRSIDFSADGQFLFSGSADMSLRAVDLNTQQLCFTKADAHESPLSRVAVHSETIVISGDDDGYVKLWDLRQKRAIFEWHDHEDYISDITSDKTRNTCITSGGDGYLSVFHMRRGKLEARSDNMEEELLSVKIIKNGEKVVVGTEGGCLDIWEWGDWGDFNDRFPGHPQSIDSIVVIDQDTVATGSSDGIIRIVQIHPNQMLGVVGEHSNLPIERMAMSRDQQFLATASHDMNVKFWNVAYLFEEDDEEESGKMEEVEESGKMEVESSSKNKNKNNNQKQQGKAVNHQSAVDHRKKKGFFADIL